MNNTETTPAPAVVGRQIGQVLAGRYRLAMFKGGDEIADVWHALDDSTEMVVTLEILRDRDNEPARQRFLAEAQRMAAIERPSVMRVAAIHNDATETFIVFEHLIPLPVVLTGLTAVAKDARPATRAAEEAAALAAARPPQTVEPSTLSAVAGPMRSAVTPEAADVAAAPAIVDLDRSEPLAPRVTAPIPRLSEALQAVSQSLTSVTAEVSAAIEAPRLIADVRERLRLLHLDAIFTAARARVPQSVDTSGVTTLVDRITPLVDRVRSLFASVISQFDRAAAVGDRVTARTRQLAGGVSAARAASAARVPPARAPKPAKVERPRSSASLPTLKLPHFNVAALVNPLARLRPNRKVLGAAAALLLAFAVFGTPLGDQIAPLGDEIANALRTVTAGSSAVAPSTGLQRAPFEVPPLSAYGAAFESQGTYPTTAPNGTIEWVVALRNTGSASWYRGIEGAQAALALPDGTGVAVQSTDYVGPGQVGWFVVHFRARAELGTYTVQLLPRIDGRGPLTDLGVFAGVTVAKNP
ncbi:MAG: hypothetical protein M3O91_09380 [Chloroflexota bacterium]|nr:hypothetical protein [Chloroflexota bacterium]